MNDTAPSPGSQEVRVVDVPESGRFEVHVGGDLAGFTEYHADGDLRVFPHTLVDEAFRGRGLAGELIGTALSATRDAGLGVLPVCPAVSGYLRSHPDLLELVPQERRAEFDL